ncbi:MAG TPA: TPM domain-containing protein [Steroidobacteraceae bacterium]
MKAALPTLALLLAAGSSSAYAQVVALPPLEARVTDLTGTLTAGQQSALEEKLAALERSKGAQVAVLILPTTQPEDIAQFGIRLAEAWKIGREAPDDGAIFIIAKDDRAMRVEVGRGLEGALTDITVSRILNDTVVPLFRAGDFAGGISAGTDQIIRVVEGEPLPAADGAWGKRGTTEFPWMAVLIAGAVVANVLRLFIGRGAGAAVAGLGGGAVVYWISAQLLQAIGAGIGIVLFALFFGFGSGFGHGRRGGRVFRDWGGGGFGGGGFGGGGGFRGGGGSFGGGGASARW